MRVLYGYSKKPNPFAFFAYGLIRWIDQENFFVCKYMFGKLAEMPAAVMSTTKLETAPFDPRFPNTNQTR
jgi:hypothetical protein